MKIVLFANTDWYLWNFRRSLAFALRDAGHEVLLLSPDGTYGPRFAEAGLRWRAVPMQRQSLNPAREAGLLWHLWRLLRDEKPDLVHGFTIKSAVYGSLAARAARVPARVNSVAGMGYVFISDSPKARLLRPLVRSLLRVALGGPRARLILQNPDDVALFREARLVHPSQVRLIAGSGVDCERFHPGALAQRAGPVRVLLPARLLWDKGLAEYVEAARQLRAEGVPMEFLLAGEPDPGNPASVPVETVKAWVADGTLSWLGHVDDMPGLLRSVHVVCLPSYREGLPKGLIEAGASGCALVTTDVPGCREVVSQDGVDGLRVPARAAAPLADALRRLHEDRDLLEALGRAARAKAVAEFDEKIVISRTQAVYEELMQAV